MPKNIIVPAFFGMLLYFLLFLGENLDFFASYSLVMWIGLLISVVFIYGLALGAINNLTNLEVGIAGLKLSSLFFGLVIPIGLFIYNNYFKEPQINYSSLLEKENITLVIDNNACEKVKYGTFTNGVDTIFRYSENNLDYELIKTTNQQIKNRIKWLDSCSYVRLEKNYSISEYIKLGNFENEYYYMYSKPVNVHSIDEESYEMILEIK